MPRRSTLGRRSIPTAAVCLAAALLASTTAAGPDRPVRPVGAAACLPGDEPTDDDFGRGLGQAAALRIPDAQRLGFAGRGVRIAVLGTGFRLDHESLQSANIVATWNFIHGDDNVENRPGDPADAEAHGTAVLSVLAACAPGTLLGTAHGAEFLLARVEDITSRSKANEARWLEALDWAASLNARVVVSPFGFREFDDDEDYPHELLDGGSTVASWAAAQAASRGMLLVTAMGDRGGGPASLVAPADADGILAVGARAQGNAAPFSGRGPTADGRIKPDLSAPGVGVTGADAADSVGYVALDGTGMAVPLVAGVAALFLEAWPAFEPNPLVVRYALLLSGHRAHAPDNAVGHGVPDAAAAILFPEGVATFAVEGVGGDGTFATLAPRFRWSADIVHPRARPVAYVIEVATDSLFQNRVLADTLEEALVVTPRRPIRPAASLWWRVIARSAQGVVRASRPDGPYAMPAWVRLRTLDPASGIFIQTARPEFVWSPLPAPAPVGPLSFDLQVISGETGAVFAVFESLSDTSLVTPEPLPFNVPFRWRVIARAPGGEADTVQSTAPFVVTSDTRPPVTQLHQNFPNPFPRTALGEYTTRIWFDLRDQANVELTVYDLRGRRVRRLIPAAGCGPVRLEPGLHGRSDSEDPCVITEWDGRDDEGRRMPPGVYLLRLRAAGFDGVRRMVFVPD